MIIKRRRFLVALKRMLPLAITPTEERLRGQQQTAPAKVARRAHDVEEIKFVGQALMAQTGRSAWTCARALHEAHPEYGSINRIYEIMIERSWRSLTPDCPSAATMEP